MDNDTNENYTTKDFGKDVAVEVAKSVATVAAAYAIILSAGFTFSTVVEFRARRAAKKNQDEN
jgi:hypothetical protein